MTTPSGDSLITNLPPAGTMNGTEQFIFDQTIAGKTNTVTINSQVLAQQLFQIIPISISGATITGSTINSSSIGATTPSTGAFTTLSASGAVSGAGFTNYVTTFLASPTPIGSVVPSTGAFTTLSATTPVAVSSGGTGRSSLLAHGVLVGEGTGGINQLAVGNTGQMLIGSSGADPGFGNNPIINAGTIDNTVIGGTTKAAGSFTTLVASSTITPSTTAGIVGTTLGDNAQAGSVGEVISAQVLFSSPVALTTLTSANVTSITLTAGDWDIMGNVSFNVGASTVVNWWAGSSSTVSATLTTLTGYLVPGIAAGVLGTLANAIPVNRVSITTNTTYYLVAEASFSTSTMSAYGYIFARRRR